MADQEVKYTLILEGIERLEKGLQSGKHHSDALGESMGHLKGAVMELVAAYAGFETLKDSLEEFNKHKVAVTELSAMYQNNSAYVRENMDQLTELAEKMETTTGIHSELTMAAEESLMKYRDLKVGYEDLIPVSAELGKVMRTDIGSAADMLGRALENPQRAMRLLMQTGASPLQVQMFENLEKTGKAAQAQAYLIDVLKSKYQGLAESAFASDALGQIEIGFKQAKEAIGEFLMKGLEKAMPYIQGFFKLVKEGSHWLMEHAAIVKTVGAAIGAAAGVLLVWTSYVKIAESVQWAWNAAMTANPIGLIIAGIAALAAGVYVAYQHFEGFRRVINTTWVAIKEFGLVIWDFLIKPFTNAYHAAAALWDVLTGDFSGAKGQIKALGQSYLDMFNDVKSGVTDVQKAWGADYSNHTTSPDKKLAEKGKAGGKIGTPEGLLGSQTDKVTGTKQVIINVSINKLVEMIKIVAENVEKSKEDIQSHVARALLAATDQFSASADI